MRLSSKTRLSKCWLTCNSCEFATHSKAEKRKVEIDRFFRQQWVISKGLAKGERVIVKGLQKVRTGTVVKLENENSANK